MFNKISQFYRGLRLKNQIYVFQSLIVFIIFSLWICLIVMAILQFTNLITSRQMTQILMKPFIHQVNTTITQTAQITLRLQQFSVMLEQFNNDLFYFIKKNEVQFGYQIENCLNGSDYLYIYTFCQQQFQSDDLANVNNFVSFQNMLIPLWLTKETINIFTFYDNTYYSQMPGQYQQNFPQHLETIQLIMNNYSLNYFYNTTYIDEKAYIQTYFQIRETKIITGSTLDFNFDRLKQFLIELIFKVLGSMCLILKVTFIQATKILIAISLINFKILQQLASTQHNILEFKRRSKLKITPSLLLTSLIKNTLLYSEAQHQINLNIIYFLQQTSPQSIVFKSNLKIRLTHFNIKYFQMEGWLWRGYINICFFAIDNDQVIEQLDIIIIETSCKSHKQQKTFLTDIIDIKMGQGQIERLNKAFCDLIYSNKKQNCAIPKKFYQDMTYEYFLKYFTFSDQMILDDIRENLQIIQ